MNERSSRSHAIFQIIIESRKMDRGEDDAVIQSVLNLVDLAGSERADQTGATGARLKEGGHINKSLLFLSNVIKRLSENEDDKYISFRDSKLTRILQASLGGNALTSIICNIKASAVEETQSTLSFAMRAKSIKNKPKVNEIVSDATMMKRLESEVRDLKTRLADALRKNESQIKVGQLEQRINNEVLKIISCSSLHDVRSQQEKRRRTWCPTTSNPNVQIMQSSMHSALPVPTNAAVSTIPTRFPNPNTHLMPHITVRKTTDFGTQPAFSDILQNEPEQFIPEEVCQFENPLQNSLNFQCRCITPELKVPSSLASTPNGPTTLTVKLEMAEQALQELQEFTNLEKQIDVEHDLYNALKQALEVVSNRNAVLEKERFVYIQMQDEFLLTKNNFNDCQERINNLQIEVNTLLASNQSANEKNEKYENELAQMSEQIKRLEMENREAVNLEFEYKFHKTKAKDREDVLLEALTEKDTEISKLKTCLKSARNEKLHGSRDELVLKSELPKCELIEESGDVCKKCEGMEQLLEKQKKLTADFENLSLEYKQLRQKYETAMVDTCDMQAKLYVLEKNQNTRDEGDCEKLLLEIAAMRVKLEKVQYQYEQLQSEHNLKNESCEELNKVVSAMRDEMFVLQEKYDKLEIAYHEQHETVAEIQREYNAIQLKYQSLEVEYRELEHTSSENCAHLKKENEHLLEEINGLKARISKAHDKLVMGSVINPHATESNIRKQIETQDQELTEMKQQFDEVQKENDDLSNQLMDSLQEGEILREQCKKMNIKIQTLEKEISTIKRNAVADSVNFESQKIAMLDEIKCLKCQLDTMTTESGCGTLKSMPNEKFISESMNSSGLGLEREFCTQINSGLSEEFLNLMNCLHEVELEYEVGKRRVFHAKELDCTSQVPVYKLFLQNTRNVMSENHDLLEHGYKLHIEGLLKKSVYIEDDGYRTRVEQHVQLDVLDGKQELEVANGPKDEIKMLNVFITELQQRIQEVTVKNEQLCAEKDIVVETTGRTIDEMRVEISKLSAELFEKSSFMEDYQRQIECLEQERADITLACSKEQDKLQEFVNDSILNDDNKTLCSSNNSQDMREAELIEKDYELQTIELQSKVEHIKSLQQKCSDLETRCMTAETEIEVIHANYEIRLRDVESVCEGIRMQLTSKEKEYTDECNRLQLELFAKLELNENECRENLRKYNNDWESSKQTYESAIHNLQKLLKELSEKCQCSALQAELQNTCTVAQDQEKTRMELQERLGNIVLELKTNSEKNANLLQKLELLEDEKKDLVNLKLIADEEIIKIRSEKENLEKERNDTLKFKMEQDVIQKNLREQLTLLEEENLHMRTTHCDILEYQKLETEFLCLEKERSETSALSEKYCVEINSLQKKSKELQQVSLELQEQKGLLEKECEEKSLELQGNIEKTNELNMQLDAAKEKISKLLDDKNVLLLKSSSDNEIIQSLRTKLETFETIQYEKKELEEQLESIKTKYDNSFKSLQQERDNISLSLEEQRKEKLTINDKVETLCLKVKSLSADLCDAKEKVKGFEQLLNDFEKQEKLLMEANHEKVELYERVNELRAALSDKNKSDEELNQLKHELKEAKAESAASVQEARIFQAQLNSMNDNLKDTKTALERQCSDLRSAVGELEFKNKSLQETNDNLQHTNANLEEQLLSATQKSNDSETLTVELDSLRARFSQLQTRLQRVVADAAAEVTCQKGLLKQQVEAFNELRSSTDAKENTFKLKKQKWEGTIVCLLQEKQTLSDKLDTNEMVIKKLENELALQKRASDSRIHAVNSPDTASPSHNRKSIDRIIGENVQLKSINVNLEDKLSAMQQKSSQTESAERKNRRLSTHDERRRLSFWGVARDVACMTDPADTNCICVELDRKLKECEKNLFIRESQVIALNLELKSHPLKGENAALIKRLQDEQEKNRVESKKHRQMIMEQKTKTALAIDAAVAAAMAKHEHKTQQSEAPPRVVGNAETQTESHLEADLHKLMIKYNDLKNICRSRYNTIKDLEGKIDQKENKGENTPQSSLEAGRIKALENQCESLKKELKVSKQKYEDAKAVLHSRREEIHRLRIQLDQT